MNIIDHIKSYHLDVLKELGNVGAGNAATSLSQLLRKKIEMTVPSVSIVSFQEIIELVGGAEHVVAATFLRIEGETPGSMFFIIPEHKASTLATTLTGKENHDVTSLLDDEISMSALQELGNILAGSYLSSLADFTNLNVHPSVPSLTIDMAGAILNYGLLEVSQVTDYAIVIDTEIKEMGMQVEERSNGHFFLLPDLTSFSKIFKALGVDTNE